MTAGEIFNLLDSAKTVRALVKSRGPFKRKLLAFLAEKGGEGRLWLALTRLSDHARKFSQTEMTEQPPTEAGERTG